ncbi:MAG: DUF1552 domain-containing protein, partial [Lentisphaeraceae bacterium]|nr:DUF1552 domain-containing protein [Lentisphaeraceae bacterium]
GGGEFGAGISADQVAAKHIGQSTYLPSLELAMQKPRTDIQPNGWNWALGGYVSWYNKTTPVPREIVPLNAFNRLFKGASISASTPAETKSVLDYIKDDTMRMKRTLGREDLYRIEQYFTSVRSLERRLQKMANEKVTIPKGTKRPSGGVPSDHKLHAEMMLDLIVLAFQTNRTKVASFMFGRANSNLRYDFLDGVDSTTHHSLSHHNNNKKKMAMCELITRYKIDLFSKMLQKMDAIKEGDKSLLDNSLIFMGCGIMDGHTHASHVKPILVAGMGGGSVKTGQHYIYRPKSPLNNLLLGMLKTAGCRLDKFGNSRGVYI